MLSETAITDYCLAHSRSPHLAGQSLALYKQVLSMGWLIDRIMDGMHPAEPNLPRAACVGRDGGLAIHTRRSSHIGQGQLVTTRATVVDVGSEVDLTAILGNAIAIRVPARAREHAQTITHHISHNTLLPDRTGRFEQPGQSLANQPQVCVLSRSRMTAGQYGWHAPC
jgi:hypothetical protein